MVIVLAVMIDVIQYRLTLFNYTNRFNGYGVMESVLDGTALAPMQYRPLVAWLWYPFKIWGRKSYEVIKVAAIALSFYAIYQMCQLFWGCGYLGTLIYAILVVSQFQFDYVEQYIEIAIWSSFIISLFTGNILWSAILLVIGSLNREMTLFLPLVYFLATFHWLNSILMLCVCGLTMLSLRILYGVKKNYVTEVVKLGVRNGGAVVVNESIENATVLLSYNIQSFKKKPMVINSMILVTFAFAGLFFNYFPMPEIKYVVIPFVLLWFTKAMFYETRVGLPLSIFVIPVILGVFGYVN